MEREKKGNGHEKEESEEGGECIRSNLKRKEEGREKSRRAEEREELSMGG